MPDSMVAALVGLAFGMACSGVIAGYFVATRPYRKVRNLFAIGLGYVVISASVVGGLLLLLGAVLHSSHKDFATFAFAVTLAVGVAMTVWREFLWRKAEGIGTAR